MIVFLPYEISPTLLMLIFFGGRDQREKYIQKSYSNIDYMDKIEK